MSLDEIVDIVESTAFRVRLNVASGLGTLLRIASEEPAVSALVGAIRDERRRRALVDRVRELTARPVDPRYENDLDIPLAVYVWALAAVDRHAGRLAAEAVARAPQCWWAPKVASEVLFGELGVERQEGATTATYGPLLDPAELTMVKGAPSGTTQVGLYGFPIESVLNSVVVRNIDLREESLVSSWGEFLGLANAQLHGSLVFSFASVASNADTHTANDNLELAA